MSLPVHLATSLEDAVPGEVVELTGHEAHHAVAVRRLKVGEALVLTDGRGTAARAEVAETGKRRLAATVTEVLRTERPRPELVVVQALPKGERGELAVEALTEIGVSTVVPWAASRSVAVWRGERAAKSHAKWSATAREAAKQARREWFPTVAPLASSDEVAALLAEADLAVVLHEDATTPMSTLPVPRDGTIVVVVGPEGGVSEEEVATFTGAGACSVRMGREVLRTSTAGVAAAAALLVQTPRWSPG